MGSLLSRRTEVPVLVFLAASALSALSCRADKLDQKSIVPVV